MSNEFNSDEDGFEPASSTGSGTDSGRNSGGSSASSGGSDSGSSGGGGGIVLSDDSKEILGALMNLGGEANTSRLKQETGLDTNKIRYRLTDSKDALQDEYGLVQVSQMSPAKWDGKGIPPKVVELTRKGRSAIQQGHIGGDVFGEQVSDEVTVSREQFDEFGDQITRLRNRVNSLMSGDQSGGGQEGDSGGVSEDELAEVAESVEELEGEFSEMRDDVDALLGEWNTLVDEHQELYEDVNNTMYPMVRAIGQAVQEKGIDIDVNTKDFESMVDSIESGEDSEAEDTDDSGVM